jgi:ribonucleoside-diphosphate reductase alpha chain
MAICETSISIDKKITGWKIKEAAAIPVFQDHHAVKRPKELSCSIHQAKVKGETWTLLVGLVDNRPYEIFGGLSKFIDIPKKHKTGILIKNGKKDGVATYNLVLGTHDDQMIIKDVVNVFENTTQGAFTRMVSLSLRHGTPINFVVEQLQKDQYSDITSFSKVIARVLKDYIPEATKTTSRCEKCGSSNMVFMSGCPRCLDCNHEKCG